MMQEIRDINTIRGILVGDHFPFKPAFDLVTRKIYFYKSVNNKNAPKYRYRPNNGQYTYVYPEFHDKVHPLINLNDNSTYVSNNIMTIDNYETTLNDRSKMPQIYTFVTEEEIYDTSNSYPS